MKRWIAVAVLGLWATAIPAQTAAMKTGSQVPDSAACLHWLITAKVAQASNHLDDWIAQPNGHNWGMSASDQAALKTMVLAWINDYTTARAAYDTARTDPTADSGAYQHSVALRARRFLDEVPTNLSPAGASQFADSIKRFKGRMSASPAVTE